MAGNAYRDIFGYSPAFVIVEYVVTEAVVANLLDTDEGITAVGCPKCTKPLVQMHQMHQSFGANAPKCTRPLVQMHQNAPDHWCKCTKMHQSIGANAPKIHQTFGANAPMAHQKCTKTGE